MNGSKLSQRLSIVCEEELMQMFDRDLHSAQMKVREDRTTVNNTNNTEEEVHGYTVGSTSMSSSRYSRTLQVSMGDAQDGTHFGAFSIDHFVGVISETKLRKGITINWLSGYKWSNYGSRRIYWRTGNVRIFPQ